MILLEYPLIILFIFGFIVRILPHKMKGEIKVISIIGALFSLIYGIYNFIYPINSSFSTLFEYRVFSGLIGLGCTFFGFIVIIFSLRYADFVELLNKYYAYIFFSIGFSLATVYSVNLLGLLVFWGLQGLTLYFLSNLLPGASNASKKSYAFIGGSDAIMILGMAILWSMTNTLEIYKIKIVLGNSIVPSAAFLCLIIAALTKAGAMPFHTWVPDFAQHMPISLTAFFPASLDKLLGIFLLLLVCNQLFVLNTLMTFILLSIGGLTIISAVSMALIQRDLKKLLSYHAISQAGYMILGIATGSPLGIAGGIFHMVNNAIYKSGLLLTASSVEHRTGKTNMDSLGGLSRFMPLTFVCCLIFSFSIAGVPPFNGFSSKWMIYLSLIQKLSEKGMNVFAEYFYILFLILAMFGSALTLASFIKVIHSVFLGQQSEDLEIHRKKYKEVGFTMMLPMGILALLCIVFGVFPYYLPLRKLIFPAISTFDIKLDNIPGMWRPDIATIFILFGLLLGFIIYLIGNIKFRKDSPFVGGEELPLEARYSGTEFYKSISEMNFFKKMFLWSENKFFDIYHVGTKLTLKSGKILSSFHMGSLQFYLLLFLVGLVGIALAYMGGSLF
ncbi:MAG: proton-conducting transporter membrane subunit [Elusimicrobia bacterium]|nr:proton-conducting transporter membrane subunit [Elusimicrobiota bacterium]